MGAEQLITESIDLWTSAIKAKATQGRGSNKKRELYGIKKLRELILELAVRGKLVPQDSNDEPANILLERIAAEKRLLVKQKTIKKPKKLAEIVDGGLPFDLPAGWTWARLQDVTSYIQRGIGPKYDEGGTVRVVSQKCVQWSGFDLKPSRHIANDSLIKYQDERFLQRRDLLWNSTGTGTVGRIVELNDIPTKALVADSHVTVIRPLEVLGGFLKAYISAPGIQSRIEPNHENALVSGSTKQVELNTSAVEALEIPIPPKAEQHKIVAKIEELMVLCDQLEQQTEASLDAHQLLNGSLLESLTNAKDASELSENWARLSEHFDSLITTDYAVEQLKQTILQLAVMGKLVPQDPTDEPASEILKCVAAEKEQLIKEKKIRPPAPLPEITTEEMLFSLPKGWEWCRIDTPSLHSEAGWSPKCHGFAREKNSWGVLKVSAVTWGEFKPQENKQLPDNLEPRPELEVRENDFLISRANTSELVARSVVVPAGAEEKLMMSDKIIRFVFSKHVSPNYLSLANNSKYSREYYARVAGGTSSSMKNVSRHQIQMLVIALPPLEEQNRIISKTNQLIALCDQLKTRIFEAETTQLRLADTVVYEIVGESVKSTEDVEVNIQTMKITTMLSLNHENLGSEAIIAPILLELGGSADAKDVWSKTKLTLPEFYAQLKTEIDALYIAMPARALF